MTAARYLLLEFVEYVCSTYDASVTSWWRSRERNEKKGGLPTSLHLTGYAIDVVYEENTETIRRKPDLESLQNVARSYFVRVVREGDHDHFQSELSHLGAKNV